VVDKGYNGWNAIRDAVDPGVILAAEPSRSQRYFIHVTVQVPSLELKLGDLPDMKYAGDDGTGKIWFCDKGWTMRVEK